MRNRYRYISAFALFVIYGLIVLGPLAAPLALRSPTIAHAITGECAGDCSICSCSPERSANHTCCCWQKKLQHAHDDDDQDEPECCKKNHPAPSKTATINGTRPCNSAKTMVLMGVELGDALPFRFCQGTPSCMGSALVALTTVCLADRPDEPPDPPPKLS